MKKITIAFDNMHFSNGALEFVRRLNEIEPVLLTGLFLPQSSYAALWNYNPGGVGEPLYFPVARELHPGTVENNIAVFEKVCRHNNIDYILHNDSYDFDLEELKKESRFADVLLIGSEVFYKDLSYDVPNAYFRDALHYAECPVLLVPEQFEFPETNILTYDGSGSSVYAIKQFAYLFPQMCGHDTLLVFAKREREIEFPDEEYITRLAARHFEKLTLLKLPVDTKKKFTNWIEGRKGSIVVSGAFGRSMLSQLFNKSFISGLITDHRLPVFIAHR